METENCKILKIKINIYTGGIIIMKLSSICNDATIKKCGNCTSYLCKHAGGFTKRTKFHNFKNY
jgi:hypothetical protein